MTKAKRIVLNVLATYGRSIVSFVVTLFTARWILMALGEEDFGIYGVVGCLAFLVNLFNNAQSGAIARYYAYYIGKGDAGCGNNRDEELQHWFNSALAIHIAMPFVFITVGWPVGEYAICNWLNFPEAKLSSCLWCFRMSLITLFFSMISVPYIAMYTAYQYITQLVAFSFIQVFANLIISYYLLFASGDRLLMYAFLLMAIHVFVNLLEVWFAHRQFPSCRISGRQMIDARRIIELMKFAFFKFLGNVGFSARNYGTAFFVNVAYGPSANAACNIAHQLSAQSVSFCSTLANSFTPAIVTEEGAGRRAEMIRMAFMCCKFGGLLVLTFAIPLLIEVDNWLRIWLVEPPKATSGICVFMVLTFILDYITSGHHLAIVAVGDVARWQVFDTITYVMAIPIVVSFYMLGVGPVSVGYAYATAMGLAVINRLIFARRIAGMGIITWVKTILVPLFGSALITLFVGALVRRFIPPTLLRVFLTGSICAVTLWLVAWLIVINEEERQYVIGKWHRLLSRITVSGNKDASQ